jgi:uncharacterized SAM-dependent methyltransferase
LPKPLLIIGSSKEGENLAKGMQASLGDTLDVELWSQMAGGLSEQILENFERALKHADFAAFIFAPDDDLTVRAEKTKTVRDNVLLELGVARGILGRERAFIVRPSNATVEMRTATDLLGVIAAEYNATEAKGAADKIRRALLPPANKVRETAEPLGFLHRPASAPSRRVKGVLPRGGTQSLAEQADAAIYVADKRGKYFEELQGFVTGKNVVPSKYLYWTPQGSAHWLQFCELEQYKFYSDSVKILEQHAETVAKEIIAAVGSAELDFISIGSGDGIKDNLILRHLHKELHADEYIYYYPVDISDMLIIEAVRNALSKGVPKEQFRVKALIADFVRLEKLQAFYEERPSPNVFSVLGNTVGNADERGLMKALADAMLPGDLVLMEVNAGEPDVNDPVWGDLVTREHDFTPLTVFNVRFDPGLIEYKSIKRESAVGGTQSILASYKEADINGDTAKGIKLSIVHYYNHKNFLSYMSKTLNVSVLWSTPEPEKGVYLALAMREKAKAMG